MGGMSKSPPSEAWVTLPSIEQSRARRPPGAPRSPYDMDGDFVPAMGRLIGAHPRIAPRFGALFAELMFAPGALTRAERELVAAVASSAQDCFY